ncbi:MAG: CehA/McbA family metallohydrolase [Caulobacteraceae bacterium]
MKSKKVKQWLNFVLVFILVLSSVTGYSGFQAVYADGTGTWDDPYSVTQAIGIQDNSVATVEGYIVGQPTATSTVVTSGFPNDYAIAIADSSGETDTSNMLYIQVASGFRAGFGLKTNPGNMGMLVKVTGNLTPYFTPHPGLKNITAIEAVTGSDTTPPVIIHTPVANAIANIPINISAQIDDSDSVIAAVYCGNDGVDFSNIVGMVNSTGIEYSADIPGQPTGDLYYYIEAADGSGSTSREPASGSYQIVISEEDITPPVINHTPVAKAWEGVDIEIAAAIADDSAFTAEVYYGRSDGGSAFVDGILMTDNGDGSYKAIIPNPEAGNLYYYIKAFDERGNTSTSPSDITVCNSIEVRDIISIAEARAAAMGSTVSVKGIVTYKDGSNYYIQDESGAIDIYRSGLTLAVGDRIAAAGVLADYDGLLEIKPASTGDVKLISSGNLLPGAKLVTIPEINESIESQLIRIEKVTLGTVNTSGNTEITDKDGNKINIYKIPALTGIGTGDIVDITAIVSQYTSYQLRVRTAEDVKKSDLDPDTVAPIITHTPVTEANAGLDLTITAVISDDRQLTNAAVYYRTKGAAAYGTINMASTENGGYTAVIPKESLSIEGLEYYIEASDGKNITTSPADKNNPYQVLISAADIQGPEITGMTPQEGSYTGNNLRPVISANYSDPSNIDLASVKLYLDGNDVTASTVVTATDISYTPGQDLAKSSHNVKLEVSDTKGNKSEKTWAFNVGEEIYNLYFGQLHSHTNYSDGQGTVEEAYAWAKNTAKADFFAITDHSNSFDNDKANGSLTDWKLSTSTEWKQLHETADAYNEDGKFAAIAGFEMTWSGSTGGWGHINTFNTNWFETRNNSSMDLKAYYDRISKDSSSISQLNHPGTTFGDFADFGYYSEGADAVVNLVEVGNGEGDVRGSGYFPSYEYYTRALDKGWHVAPSNNQDNHKAEWVTANEARTVVLAPSLTRENIYDAIRDMRVYATEDSNLSINYTVNSKPMGSVLNSPETLNFNIYFEDPDTAEYSNKISIITEGGITVAEKTFDSNTGRWDLQLDPQYKYYYIRVDQKDMDIAVTAPIWTGEVVPVGLSKVGASQDPTIVNTPVKLDATVYNNSSAQLSNITVEFFKNSVSAENKIGEAVVSSIDSGSSGAASIDWIPDKTGKYSIYAQTTINIEGQDKTFTQSTSISVENEEDIIKVLIDAGHYNQYVSGDYSGKILTLKAMLKEKGYMVVENKDELTAEDLKGARLLILTDPQSKDSTKYNLFRSLYTDAEAAVIKQYMDEGGSLIITSRADYDDKGVTELQYQTAAQGNKILEAIGSNLRFNDDEVIDNTSNGGQNFRLYFDDYTSSKYNLANGIPEGETYSAYSGCSVLLKQDGNEERVDWLVKGHGTTETLDSDLQGDNIPVEKGDVRTLAAEVLNSGARLVAAGTTFLSDFETASSDNAYSNKQITENIISWLVQPKPVEQKTIAEVRVDSDKDGVPDLLGKKFAVEGRVTAQSTGVGTNNAFFDVIYVQDETGGITVFGVSGKVIPLGVKVKVTGRVDQYDGDTELQVSNEATDIEITDSTVELVMPREMPTAESMSEEDEGMLVKVQGIVTRMTDNSIYLDDGSGEARIYINGYIGDGTDNPEMTGKWDKNIVVGDTVSAVGLASEDTEGHRLRVRNTAEIIRIYIPVTGIQVDSSTIKMRVGEAITLIVSVLPANATNKNLIWTSDKASVAVVENGVLKGLRPGTAKITVTTVDGNYSASFKVIVSNGQGNHNGW